MPIIRTLFTLLILALALPIVAQAADGKKESVEPNKGQIHMFDLKDMDRAPSPRYQAQPAYPFEAKRKGISGAVTIEFAISDKGEVVNPHVVSSTNRSFEKAALDAIQRSTFTPGRKDGKAVFTRRVQTTIRFDIEDV